MSDATLSKTPKPGSWVKPPVEASVKSSESSEASSTKKPFVPKPHLTDRPFKEGLQALRDSMQSEKIKKSGSYGKKPRRK